MSFIKMKQSNAAAYNEQSSTLRSAYRSLVLTSSLVAIMAGTYFAMNCEFCESIEVVLAIY